MKIERDQEIRELAYAFWQAEGYRHGYDVQHWLKAEVIWLEKYGAKSTPKRSKPVKKKTTRKVSSADTEMEKNGPKTKPKPSKAVKKRKSGKIPSTDIEL